MSVNRRKIMGPSAKVRFWSKRSIDYSSVAKGGKAQITNERLYKKKLD